MLRRSFSIPTASYLHFSREQQFVRCFMNNSRIVFWKRGSVISRIVPRGAAINRQIGKNEECKTLVTIRTRTEENAFRRFVNDLMRDR